MKKAASKEISFKFETDSLTTVSPETAHRLVEFMDSNSLEDLIQLLLRNLAAEPGVNLTSLLVAYPLRGKHLI